MAALMNNTIAKAIIISQNKAGLNVSFAAAGRC